MCLLRSTIKLLSSSSSTLRHIFFVRRSKDSKKNNHENFRARARGLGRGVAESSLKNALHLRKNLSALRWLASETRPLSRAWAIFGHPAPQDPCRLGRSRRSASGASGCAPRPSQQLLKESSPTPALVRAPFPLTHLRKRPAAGPDQTGRISGLDPSTPGRSRGPRRHRASARPRPSAP